MSTAPKKPGPEATNWENDYRLLVYWTGRIFAIWDAIPVEFRGDVYNPPTLVEKVESLVKTIYKLREENTKLSKLLEQLESDAKACNDHE